MNAVAPYCRTFGIALLGVALFAWVWHLADSPAARPRRAGLRGLRRQQALAHSAFWRATEPLLRWLGARATTALPEGVRGRLDRYLRACGDPLGLDPAELAVLTLLSFVGGLVCGAVLGPLLSMGASLACMLAPLGAALPCLLLSHAAAQRLDRIRRGLPHALELVALAMCAGCDFQGALAHVTSSATRAQDPLCEEFRCLLRELQLGRTRRQALLALGERVALDEIAEFVAAAAQAERQGTPLAQVLQTLAAASRLRRTVSAETAASRAGVQMVAPLFLVFLSAMLLVMGPLLLDLSRGAAAGGVYP